MSLDQLAGELLKGLNAFTAGNLIMIEW